MVSKTRKRRSTRRRKTKQRGGFSLGSLFKPRTQSKAFSKLDTTKCYVTDDYSTFLGKFIKVEPKQIKFENSTLKPEGEKELVKEIVCPTEGERSEFLRILKLYKDDIQPRGVGSMGNESGRPGNYHEVPGKAHGIPFETYYAEKKAEAAATLAAVPQPYYPSHHPSVVPSPRIGDGKCWMRPDGQYLGLYEKYTEPFVDYRMDGQAPNRSHDALYSFSSYSRNIVGESEFTKLIITDCSEKDKEKQNQITKALNAGLKRTATPPPRRATAPPIENLNAQRATAPPAPQMYTMPFPTYVDQFGNPIPTGRNGLPVIPGHPEYRRPPPIYVDQYGRRLPTNQYGRPVNQYGRPYINMPRR